MLTKEQPQFGQTVHLPLSANTDPRTTHVAIHKTHGFKYFCRFDPSDVHPQEGVPDADVLGTYWIVPCHLYGSCYNACSLWQGGFNFEPIENWK